MTRPWRSGGLQLADAELRIEALKAERARDPAGYLLQHGEGGIARAEADCRALLLAVRAAIDGELARLGGGT